MALSFTPSRPVRSGPALLLAKRVPAGVPVEASADVRVEARVEASAEAPVQTSADVPAHVPASRSAGVPAIGERASPAADTTTMVPAPVLPSLAVSPASLARAELLAQPARVHPGLWRALGGNGGGGVGGHGGAVGAPGSGACLSSGFAALDAELPGGGWPVRVLTELLLPQPGVGEIRLLAPVLTSLARAGRSVMLFEPPAELNAVSLAELGCPPGQCIVVRCPPASASPRPGGSRKAGSRRVVPGAELCWSIEQALRSGQIGAVLAWPGRAARPEALRRLQLAAQSHEGPAFLLREWAVQAEPSPAPLRVTLQPAGADDLALRIVKRKGPAMAQALCLKLAPVLSPRALARAQTLPRPRDVDAAADTAADAATEAMPAGADDPGHRSTRPERPAGNRRPPPANPASPSLTSVRPSGPFGPFGPPSPTRPGGLPGAVLPPANSAAA